MDVKRTKLPITKDMVSEFHAGDYVLLSGELYTARDAAHKRMAEEFEKTGCFPIDIMNVTLYYLGPSPAKPGQVIGSAGPTTSSRMDKYTPMLLEKGMTAMIGKGKRSKEVIESMKKNHAVYFAAIGGAGALLSKCIKECEIAAYGDLGPEAIYRLRVEDFPVTVVIDESGNDLYEKSI